jgi:hypothetical protein
MDPEIQHGKLVIRGTRVPITRIVGGLAGGMTDEPRADTYHEKYTEFLKIDFPRIPFTADFELFQTLAALGKRLVGLHLLRSEELDPPAARFQGQGDNRVAHTQGQGFGYEPKEERVHVNKTQYFEPVPLERGSLWTRSKPIAAW